MKTDCKLIDGRLEQFAPPMMLVWKSRNRTKGTVPTVPFCSVPLVGFIIRRRGFRSFSVHPDDFPDREFFLVLAVVDHQDRLDIAVDAGAAVPGGPADSLFIIETAFAASRFCVKGFKPAPRLDLER